MLSSAKDYKKWKHERKRKNTKNVDILFIILLVATLVWFIFAFVPLHLHLGIFLAMEAKVLQKGLYNDNKICREKKVT